MSHFVNKRKGSIFLIGNYLYVLSVKCHIKMRITELSLLNCVSHRPLIGTHYIRASICFLINIGTALYIKYFNCLYLAGLITPILMTSRASGKETSDRICYWYFIFWDHQYAWRITKCISLYLMQTALHREFAIHHDYQVLTHQIHFFLITLL